MNLVAYVLYDPRHKPRGVTLECLLQTWFEFVQHIHACAVAHARAEVAEWLAHRAPPVGSGGSVRHHCCKGAQEIRGVYPALSRFVPRDKCSRGCMHGAVHQVFSARRRIPGFLIRRRRLQVLGKKSVRIFLAGEVVLVNRKFCCRLDSARNRSSRLRPAARHARRRSFFVTGFVTGFSPKDHQGATGPGFGPPSRKQPRTERNPFRWLQHAAP